MSAESAGGTIDWDIPMKLPRSVLLAARQARAAQDAATHSVRLLPALPTGLGAISSAVQPASATLAP